MAILEQEHQAANHAPTNTRSSLSRRQRRYWQLGLIVIAFLFLALGLYLQNMQRQAEREQDALLAQAIIEQGNLATLKISQQFSQIQDATADIAQQLAKNTLNDKQIRALIARKVITTNGAFRGGVVFKRGRFPDSIPLYSPFYQKGADNKPNQHLSDRYDYTQADDIESDRPRTFWFHQPLQQGPMWLSPYYGTSAKSWIAEYIRPFTSSYDGNESNGYDGIIFLNLSLKGLSHIVSQLELAQSGFGFILTANDELISYPVTEYLGQKITDIKYQESFFNTLLEQREKGPVTSFIHPINKKECWLFFSKIPGTNDTLGILVWADELRAGNRLEKVSFSSIKLSQLFILVACILLLGTLRFPHNMVNVGYRFSILISFMMLISLMSIWTDKLNGELNIASENQVFEEVNVNNFLLKNTLDTSHSDNSNRQDETHISFQIKALTQLDPGTIQIIGRMSLAKLAQQSENPPIYFPQSNNTQWEKLSNIDEVQTWKFTADLRQPLNYASFPFDMEEIQIQIQTKNQLANQVLRPDFEQYKNLDPASLPGINKNDLELNGWQIKQSYFSYQVLQENLQDEVLLTFNLVIKRIITGPIITHLLPLIMVSCLAFCTLLLWTKKERKITLWGFSSSTVLEQCAALFFILVISHVSLRDELEAKGMIFLEYFYFGAYAQIVFVAVAAIVYTSDIPFRILDFKEGLIIKMLYWPTCFFFCIFITLMAFD